MKSINVTFEDAEYTKLAKAKGDKTWHDFILKLVTE
jgi:predicted CopG family antitoxin